MLNARPYKIKLDEVSLEDQAFETDAGEVMYFDKFANEWIVIRGE